MKAISLKKLLSVSMAAALLFACLPSWAGAASLSSYNINMTGATSSSDVPDSLKDGQIWTDRSVSVESADDARLRVSLSALGQRYVSTSTTVVPTVTVLVIDTSGSMDYDIEDTGGTNSDEESRMEALQDAANRFVDSVVGTSGSTNYIAIATYSTYAYTSLSFTNNRSTLKNKIANLDPDGGTNTHGGLIAAYKMINNPTSFGLTAAQIENAVYSVVFMSDGEPTYYYTMKTSGGGYGGGPGGGGPGGGGPGGGGPGGGSTSLEMNSADVYDKLGFDSSGRLSRGTYTNYTLNYEGPGSSSNSSTISNAAAAANVIKNNGVKPSVYSVYIYNEDYDEAEETMNTIASSPDNVFTPSTAEDLSATFENIALSIKTVSCTPITESTLSSGALATSSYVSITDKLGSAYSLSGSTMNVRYHGNDCTFSDSDGDGTYAYTGSAYPELQSVVVKTAVTSGVTSVTFKVPASVLPCSDPDATKTVGPIVLSYVIELSDLSGGAGSYSASGGCTVTFTPAADNPYYHPENSTDVATYTTADVIKTVNYKATYLENSYSSATLTSLAYGVDTSAYTFITDPLAQSNTYSRPSLSTAYNGIAMDFAGRTAYTATAGFGAAVTTTSPSTVSFSVKSLAIASSSGSVDPDYVYADNGSAAIYSVSYVSRSTGTTTTSTTTGRTVTVSNKPSVSTSGNVTTYTTTTVTTTPYEVTTSTPTTYYYNIYVKYGNNQYIYFKNVPFVSTAVSKSTYDLVTTSTSTYKTVPVSLRTTSTSPGKNNTTFRVGSSGNYSSISSISGRSPYTIKFSYNSVAYEISGVTFSNKKTNNYYTASGTGSSDTSTSSQNSQTNTSTTSSTAVGDGSMTSAYYFTSGSTVTTTTMPDYILTYSAHTPETLNVSYGLLADGSGYTYNYVFIRDVDNSDGITTVITYRASVGKHYYTAKVVDENARTCTIYSYTAVPGDPSKLLVCVSTMALEEVPDSEGVVTMSLSSGGVITLENKYTPEELGELIINTDKLTLKSLSGTDYAVADSKQTSYVVFKFEVQSNDVANTIKNVTIELRGTDGPTFTPMNALPSVLGVGTYEVTYKVKTNYGSYDDMPSSINTYFYQLKFDLNDGSGDYGIVNARAGYTDQKVTVYLKTPQGH